MHRFTDHTRVIAVLDRLPGKVPYYETYTQKAQKCNIPMSLVGHMVYYPVVMTTRFGFCMLPNCHTRLHCV